MVFFDHGLSKPFANALKHHQGHVTLSQSQGHRHLLDFHASNQHPDRFIHGGGLVANQVKLQQLTDSGKLANKRA